MIVGIHLGNAFFEPGALPRLQSVEVDDLAIDFLLSHQPQSLADRFFTRVETPARDHIIEFPRQQRVEAELSRHEVKATRPRAPFQPTSVTLIAIRFASPGATSNTPGLSRNSPV